MKYVVNKNTGEALNISEYKFRKLKENDIVLWNDKLNCYTFESKYKICIKDETVDELMKMDNILDEIFDNFSEVEIIKSKLTFTIPRIDDTFIFVIVIEPDNDISFWHVIDGKWIIYDEVFISDSKKKMVKKFDKEFIDMVYKVAKGGSDKYNYDYFNKMVSEYSVNSSLVADKIIMKNVVGLFCTIKSNLMVSSVIFTGKGRKKIRVKSTYEQVAKLVKFVKKMKNKK